MITLDGQRTTAKAFAATVLSDTQDLATYWSEKYETEYSAMTERERAQVAEQLTKLIDRLQKILLSAGAR